MQAAGEGTAPAFRKRLLSQKYDFSHSPSLSLPLSLSPSLSSLACKSLCGSEDVFIIVGLFLLTALQL